MGCQDLLDDVPGRSRKGDGGQSGGAGGGSNMFSSPSDLKSFMKGVTRSSSKSYSIKDETSSECLLLDRFIRAIHICTPSLSRAGSYGATGMPFYYILFTFIFPFSLSFADEIMAVLKLDNVTVGQTNWRPCSQQAWDQR